ncbi:hypothetical protein WJX81_007289 [Elliptochloris bilobata]|uniref:mannan endo-1,4-beta-mannosidase n=1 Tax=Elliptochloris bilobata TaxID=381761 RepID=A0AAW1SM07_9CHLO
MGDCEVPANLSSFVRVTNDGMRFEVDGSPFFFAGANCYYLMTRAGDKNLRYEVLEVLDETRAAGLSVVRTWAFADGAEWNALQPAPGEWDERIFAALDWVLAQAGARGLRMILVLTNYWEAYGGIKQYVRWSCERRGVEVNDRAEDFYADPYCQDVFRTFVATLLARVNTITGVVYRDDPTILAWELCNEPRCEGDFSGSIVQDWVEQQSEFLKSLDPYHLLTIGAEGFLGSSTPELLADNPFDTLKLGCDFLRHHALPHIDFATAHLWPDTWLPASASEAAKMRFARRWVNVHTDVCTEQLGKPLVLTEFGTKASGRPAFYEKVYDTVLHHMVAGHAVAGTCFWMLAATSYPDYDGFTLAELNRRGTAEGVASGRECSVM